MDGPFNDTIPRYEVTQFNSTIKITEPQKSHYYSSKTTAALNISTHTDQNEGIEPVNHAIDLQVTMHASSKYMHMHTYTLSLLLVLLLQAAMSNNSTTSSSGVGGSRNLDSLPKKMEEEEAVGDKKQWARDLFLFTTPKPVFISYPPWYAWIPFPKFKVGKTCHNSELSKSQWPTKLTSCPAGCKSATKTTHALCCVCWCTSSSPPQPTNHPFCYNTSRLLLSDDVCELLAGI